MINKTEIIEEFSISKVKETFEQLLTALGMHDISMHDNYIKAIEDGKLSQNILIFIVPNYRLSGTGTDIDSIKKTITEIKNTESTSDITIVSNFHISNGFKESLNQENDGTFIKYIDRDSLISLFDKYLDDVWSHEDTKLKLYEKNFKETLKQESQLKLLRLPSEKYQKLLDCFIQPTLLKYEEDSKTHTCTRKRLSMNDLIQDKEICIISGISGSGKSTLLKNMALQLIEENAASDKTKYKLPIFITSTDLLEALRNIETAIEIKLKSVYGENVEWKNIAKQYDVVLFIDSIDEFDEEEQKNILRKIGTLYENRGIRSFIGTRSTNKMKDSVSTKDIYEVSISRFNSDQIRRFISMMLPNNDKVDDLMESLRENKILERLPITPLTLSLISILYDEQDYEIPATITDIYKNFNNLIVGRSVVSSKLDFIDVSFKERILSNYGYELMKTENHKPLTKDEFFSHFHKFYADKTLPINNDQFNDVLEYLLRNTGILYIKDNNFVCFSHDSYMEYYAAVEMFNFRRDEESLLVENFLDIKWQNVAIFYAGMTKDMVSFAIEINKRLKKSNSVTDFMAGIQGAGYILQALYQTDNNVRKDIVLTTLNLVMELNEIFKKMASLNKSFLKNYHIPIILAANFFHFYEMFNSLTLKQPLLMAFNELKNELEKLEKIENLESYDYDRIPSICYKILELAFTLDSKRINDNSALDYILGKKQIYQNQTLGCLANLSFDLLGKEGYKEMNSEIKKKMLPYKNVLSSLMNDDANKIRFSPLDAIRPNRKYKIFVEGKTDATILEHAYMILTGGNLPYWSVVMASKNGETGSSSIVSDAVESAVYYKDAYNVIVGIYDHDKAGLSEYRRLSKDYDELEKDTIKKRKDANVYLMCLPVPGEMKQYLNEKQDFNFFEIEHYFGHDYLREKQVLKNTETLPNIYEIKDNSKVKFSEEICNETDPYKFKYFKDLFEKLDSIFGEFVEYVL